MQALHQKNLEIISASSSSRTREKVITIFTYLERNPIADIKNTSVKLGMAYNTVAAVFEKLCEWNILEQRDKTGRMRTYAYEDYLKILRADTEIL